MQFVFSKQVYFLVRLVVAGFFLTAGALKLLDLESFAVTIEAFGMAPHGTESLLALLLPLLEIAAGVGLILDKPWGLHIVAGMLLLFIAVLLYAVHLGLDVDCGCYGPGDPEGEALHSIHSSLVRDLWLAGCVAYLYIRRFFTKPFRSSLGSIFLPSKSKS